MAAMMGDVDTVRRFLQAGINPNATDELLRTPVHHAAHLDCVEVLVALQDYGGDLDLVDADVSRSTALFVLCVCCCCHVPPEHNFLSNLVLRQVNTPLHIASMHGYAEVVMFLLQSAVDVNIQNKNGDTALHLAVKQRQFEVCRQLLAYGADQTIRNNTGYTAHDTVTLVAPHRQGTSIDAMENLFAGNGAVSMNNFAQTQPAGRQQRPRKVRSSSNLRLQIPDQSTSAPPARRRPSSVRDARTQLRREPTHSSLDETGSSEEESSSDSNSSSGWNFGSFLYRTTMRLVGMGKETEGEANTRSKQVAESSHDLTSRRNVPPTDAELAAEREHVPLSSPPAEVMQDIRQKAKEIQRNTPRGREVVYPQVKPPADVVLAYDMAKAAARASPPSIPPAATNPAQNMYSLAAVPPDARKNYIDYFEAQRDTSAKESGV